MPYPVKLVGGTDELQIEPGGRVYHIGDTIRDLPDYKRTSLQASGVRFAAVHDDDDPAEDVAPDAVLLPPDQVAVNDEIAAAQVGISSSTAAKADAKADPKAKAGEGKS